MEGLAREYGRLMLYCIEALVYSLLASGSSDFFHMGCDCLKHPKYSPSYLWRPINIKYVSFLNHHGPSNTFSSETLTVAA